MSRVDVLFEWDREPADGRIGSPDGRGRYWGRDIPPGLGCGGVRLLVSVLSSSDEGVEFIALAS